MCPPNPLKAGAKRRAGRHEGAQIGAAHTQCPDAAACKHFVRGIFLRACVKACEKASLQCWKPF